MRSPNVYVNGAAQRRSSGYTGCKNNDMGSSQTIGRRDLFRLPLGLADICTLASGQNMRCMKASTPETEVMDGRGSWYLARWPSCLSSREKRGC
jgi:hypothetical protein